MDERTEVVLPGSTMSLGNRLEVEGVLGRGMAGEVFKARDRETGQLYVVKRLRRQVARHLDLVRFVREANLMRRLRHPNLMPAVHVETQADPPFFLMPWREGRPVSQRLAEGGRLAPALVVRIARDACFGLAEAHRLGIVHRDVKPGNLFLEASGRTVVFDFGLAKDLRTGEGLTAAGSILGTPAYMAPEQCRGESVDERADVYSLGVTLFELLLGKNPFANPDLVETIRRQLEETPRRLDALIPHKVGPELGELIHRMIAKDPKHRPTSESCLETFAGVARHLEVEARASTRCVARPTLVAG
jgi:serine/threonine protein kinase